MFDVYEVAKTAVREMRTVVETVQTCDRDLARQMRRAGAERRPACRPSKNGELQAAPGAMTTWVGTH